MGLEKFILVGHSMGGRNSMAFGGKYPEKLEKLIIVDVGPALDSRGSNRISEEIRNVPEEFDSFEDVFNYQNAQNRFSSEEVMRRRVQYSTKELPDRKIGWKYDILIREQRRNNTVPPSDDLWPSLPNITCPSLIVRGVHTDILAEDVAQRMVETLPNVELVQVEQAAHMVFEDNPADFIAAVKQFLG
ncbi:Putative esterase/lipase HI_0193 [Geodia barretti]|uniref:sn-1-specific diacylglycerol lipase ABHD11 n=1 Tax=Geodia barretti TaxID=519541 RepID=A0AA35RI01_GEOBA|nr:Putative esterase/lipase HI_0193 [Geodia barretti]